MSKESGQVQVLLPGDCNIDELRRLLSKTDDPSVRAFLKVAIRRLAMARLFETNREGA